MMHYVLIKIIYLLSLQSALSTLAQNALQLPSNLVVNEKPISLLEKWMCVRLLQLEEKLGDLLFHGGILCEQAYKDTLIL